MFYQPTLLEKWVTSWYEDIGILSPNDIDVEVICESKNIIYEEKPIFSHYVISNNKKLIFVDDRIEKVDKREHFFHELGHVEFHSGLQSSMSESLNFVQEKDATNFSRYALIPYHMLQYIDFYSVDVIREVAETFNVSERVSMDRLYEIKRRAINDNKSPPINNPKNIIFS